MGKKKGWKSVVWTIIITVLVLGGLTYAALEYLLPLYNVHAEDVYSVAINAFPLLIGLVLIVIASMIMHSRNPEDEEDMLPPNSYDAQLFEQPKDDPAKNEKCQKPQAVPAVSVIDVPQDNFQEVSEEPSEEAESEAPVAQENQDSPVYDALNLIVAKLDDLTDKMSEKAQAEEETKFDRLITAIEGISAEKEETGAAEPSEAPVQAVDNSFNIQLLEALSALSDKIDNLSIPVASEEEDIFESLSDDEFDSVEEDSEDESMEEAEKEEPAAEPAVAPVVVPVVAPAAEAVVTEVEKVLEDFPEIYEDEAQRHAFAEFKSAQDLGYDITICKMEIDVDSVKLELSDADVFDKNGCSIIILPFVSEEEAKEMLDKFGKPYESVTASAGDGQDFETLAGKYFS